MAVILHWQKKQSYNLGDKEEENCIFKKNFPLYSDDLFLWGMSDISICYSFFPASPLLLCADWKILSFISLLLPATGAGWRIHARWTMQPRRLETKENLTSPPRLTEQRNCIHKADKWTTAGEAVRVACSLLLLRGYVQARGDFFIVLDLICICFAYVLYR